MSIRSDRSALSEHHRYRSSTQTAVRRGQDTTIRRLLIASSCVSAFLKERRAGHRWQCAGARAAGTAISKNGLGAPPVFLGSHHAADEAFNGSPLLLPYDERGMAAKSSPLSCGWTNHHSNEGAGGALTSVVVVVGRLLESS